MDDHTRDPSVGPPRGEPTGWHPETGRWEHATLRRATVHGVRLFNAGAYHESHDVFEAEWYNYGRGSTESAYLHGMVQVAAGAYKRVDLGDDVGAASLLGTARSYLVGVPADFYGVDLVAIRATLERAVEELSVVDDWVISLDSETPVARPVDRAYAAELE